MEIDDEEKEPLLRSDPMECEDTASSQVLVKRPAEGEPDQDEDKMVQALEILQADIEIEEDESQIRLETGDWCPKI